jgi:opacity protein-like surface antigen
MRIMIAAGALLAFALTPATMADDAETFSPTQRWEGFYAGFGAGQGSGEYSRYTNDNAEIDGTVFGAHMGYHYPIDDRIVVGIEIAGEYSDVSGSETRVVCTTTGCGYEVTRDQESNRNFGGHILLEAGVTIGDFLVSGLAGPAWGQYERTNSYHYAGGPNMGIQDINTQTTDLFGWAYGARVSILTFGDNASVEAQWLRTSLSGDEYENRYRDNVYTGGQSAEQDALTLRVSIRR